MARIFRNIRFHLIGDSKTGKYIKYAIGEIFLVVVGILIALQINNWNTKRILLKEEAKIYHNIGSQLHEDRLELTKVKALNNYQFKVYEFANNIIERKDYSQQDSLALCIMGLSIYSDFHRTGNIYETLITSGDIKLINNDTIPTKLQKLEMTYTFTNKLEDMHWEMINSSIAMEMRGIINYSNFKPVKPMQMYTTEMQNAIVTSMYLTATKDSVYTQALREIDKLTDLIDNELASTQ